MYSIMLIVFETVFVNAMHSSKALEGYPAGYLADCVAYYRAMENMKYRYIYEYEFYRGTSAAETARRINDVYGAGVAKDSTVRFWFQRLRLGNFDLKNQPRGRPEIKVKNEELKAIVEADPSQSTSEIAAGFGGSSCRNDCYQTFVRQPGPIAYRTVLGMEGLNDLIMFTHPKNDLVSVALQGPGSITPIKMQADALKFLTMSVQTSQTVLYSTTTYTYFQMEELAKDTHLNFSKPTILYVGGYLDHPSFLGGPTLGPLYMKLGFNVLLLNTNPFTLTDYSLAARNVRSIAKPAAEILVHLTRNGLDPKQLSIIGLSLGAHTAGFIAKEFKLLTGNSISRITGLDPSGPCFRNLGPEDRLDESDADFVDTIKTNIDGYGMAAPIGHVNFYVNGGEYQPGDFLWVPCTGICSHIRSFTLWVAALNNPDSFIAMKCDSVQDARDRNCYERSPSVTNVIGLNTKRDVKGIFYVATSNNYPYYLREKGLQRKYEFFRTHLRISKGKSKSKKTGITSNTSKSVQNS